MQSTYCSWRNQPRYWKVLCTTVSSSYEYNELAAGYRYDFRIKWDLHPDFDPIYTSCFINSRYVVISCLYWQ